LDTIDNPDWPWASNILVIKFTTLSSLCNGHRTMISGPTNCLEQVHDLEIVSVKQWLDKNTA